MAKQKFYFSNFLLSLFICFLVIVLLAGYKLFLNHTVPFPSPLTNTYEYNLLVDAAVWYPSAPWSHPAKDTQTTFYGTLSGLSIHAQITSDKPMLGHFEDVNSLATSKFLPDTNLEADGPGASSWGYLKDNDGKKQLLLFSYKTQPSSSNSNEPLQFSCPCKIDVTVFASSAW
ncbi:MAG TPA: hypothetical protein VLB73_00420 [Patescibacteria group bacterium]|nr:hypothetical protein [Patescibacteria group bacterium]